MKIESQSISKFNIYIFRLNSNEEKFFDKKKHYYVFIFQDL